MNTLKSILVITLGTICVLTLAITDLIRALQSKQSVDEEWHEDYVYSNYNNGRGRRDI